MLFNDLLEAGIIELGEFGQVMNISDDITEDLLQQQKVIVSGRRSGRDVPLGNDVCVRESLCCSLVLMWHFEAWTDWKENLVY